VLSSFVVNHMAVQADERHIQATIFVIPHGEHVTIREMLRSSEHAA
jgi:hypothetical protein